MQKNLGLWLILLTIIVLNYQSCSENSLRRQQKSLQNKSAGSAESGNGDAYGGKLTYLTFEIGHYCKDSQGNEIPSARGIIEKTDQQYSLKFDNCVNEDIHIPAAEITAIESAGKIKLFYKERLYERYDTAPDIAKLMIPEKFCFETKALDLVGTSETASFYELNTFGSYSNGLSTSLLKREVLSGTVNLTVAPLLNIEIKPVEKIEESSFIKYLSEIFTLSLDLSLSKQKQIKDFIYQEYPGVGSLQLVGELSASNLNLICTSIPILPLIFGPAPPSTPPTAPDSSVQLIPTQEPIQTQSLPQMVLPVIVPPPPTILPSPAPLPTSY
jgi:hypothetical protein